MTGTGSHGARDGGQPGEYRVPPKVSSQVRDLGRALGSLSDATRRAEVLPGHVHRSPAMSCGTARAPPCWALPLAGLRAVIVLSLRCSEWPKGIALWSRDPGGAASVPLSGGVVCGRCRWGPLQSICFLTFLSHLLLPVILVLLSLFFWHSRASDFTNGAGSRGWGSGFWVASWVSSELPRWLAHRVGLLCEAQLWR